MPMRSRPRLFLGPEHSRAGRGVQGKSRSSWIPLAVSDGIEFPEAAFADRVARAGVGGVVIGATGGRQ